MTIHVDENTTLEEILEHKHSSIYAKIKAIRVYRDIYHSGDNRVFLMASKELIKLCEQTTVHRDEYQKVIKECELRNITDLEGIFR